VDQLFHLPKFNATAADSCALVIIMVTANLSSLLTATSLRVVMGPGLSANELAKLCSTYNRASSSVGKQGTDLGYFFSRSSVEAHGGTFGCQEPAPA
jgi:hypothetical protein